MIMMRLAKTFILLAFLHLLFVTGVNAQKSSAIAVHVKVSDKVPDASILCAYPEGNSLCNRAYDPNTFGVVVIEPALSFETVEKDAQTVPVVTSGKVYVNVSSINGTIVAGDFITSSLKPGVGQKAIKSGFVLGTAMEDYTESDPEKVGKILVLVTIKPAILSK